MRKSPQFGKQEKTASLTMRSRAIKQELEMSVAEEGIEKRENEPTVERTDKAGITGTT
jgi:hypothetical protein